MTPQVVPRRSKRRMYTGAMAVKSKFDGQPSVQISTMS
jgi:hypothetical protein